MFLVFTFFPLPSQLVLIPAGYFAFLGKQSLILILISGTLGGVAGAHFNYYFAKKVGREFIIKYRKYLFVNKTVFEKLEIFFNKYGLFAVTLSFVIPGVGQLASLPAGLAKMNKKYFFISSLIGSFVWNSMMVFLGYYFGEYQELLFKNLDTVFIAIFLIAVIFVIIFRSF